MLLMMLLIPIVSAVVRSGRVAAAGDVFLNDERHRTELLFENVSDPYILAVDYGSNDLYFTVNDRPVRFALTSREFEYIEVNGSDSTINSMTVDQESHSLFIGTGGRGIYRSEAGAIVAQPVGASRVGISTVYHRGALYYTKVWPHYGVFTLDNGRSYESVHLHGYLVSFVIDNEDVMFYQNSSGLYSRARDDDGNGGRVTYHAGPYGYELATDRNGNVYFSAADGIYEVDKYNAKCKRIVFIENPRAIAFDMDNNIIFCTADNNVYRVKPITERNNTNDSDRHERSNYRSNNNNADNDGEKMPMERKPKDMNNKINNIDNQLGSKLDIIIGKLDQLLQNYQAETPRVENNSAPPQIINIEVRN